MSCVDRIMDEFPEANRDDVQAVYDALQGARREAFVHGMTNPGSIYREKAKKILDGYRRAVKKAENKALENIAKAHNNRAFARNPIFGEILKSQWVNFAFRNPVMKGLEAILVGTNVKGISGSRLSVAARKDGIFDVLGAGFMRDLVPEDLDVLKSGSVNKQIFSAMFDIGRGKAPAGDGASIRIAKALVNLDRAILTHLNDAGAYIDELEGHVFVQSHSVDSIKAVSREQWIEDIIPLLDHERTFNGDILPIKDIHEYLGSIYDDIVTEKYKSMQEDSSDQVIKILGMPANLSKRLGQQRKLHFKSGEALFDYNEKYGTKDLSSYIYSRINTTARNVALMEAFGTNPKASFERMMQEAGATREEMSHLDNIWRELDGTTSIPGEGGLALAGQTLRATQNASKMGMSLFASIPDTATRAANLFASNGQGAFQAFWNTFSGIVGNLTSAQKSEVARLTGVGIETMLGKIHDRFSGEDWRPGAVSSINDWTFRLSLLSPWTDANRAAHAQSLSSWLGQNASKTLADVPNGARLSAYGIGVPEWEVARLGVEGGYLSLPAIDRVPLDKIKAAMDRAGLNSSPAKAEKFRREVRNKMATYFSSEVKIAMNEAGPYERALLNRGTSQDQVMGVVARLISQFKSYPLTILTKSMDDVVLGNGALSWSHGVRTGKANFQGIAYLMAGTTIMAYIGESMREMAKGKEPLNASEPETWLKVLQRGGAFGLYGDFLLGEFDSRHGRNALSALAGPVFGQFSDVMDLKTKIMQSAYDEDTELGDASTQAMRLLLNNTPGANMFWLRAPADYMFLYAIQEHMNPGFIERTRHRLQEEGRDFLIEPN